MFPRYRGPLRQYDHKRRKTCHPGQVSPLSSCPSWGLKQSLAVGKRLTTVQITAIAMCIPYIRAWPFNERSSLSMEGLCARTRSNLTIEQGQRLSCYSVGVTWYNVFKVGRM